MVFESIKQGQKILVDLENQLKNLQEITPEEVQELNRYPSKKIKGWSVRITDDDF